MGRETNTEWPPEDDTDPGLDARLTRQCLCGREIPPDPRVRLQGAKRVVAAVVARMLGGRIMRVVPGGARSFTHDEARGEGEELLREADVEVL